MSHFLPTGKPRDVKVVELEPLWGLGMGYIVDTPDPPFSMNEVVKHKGRICRLTAATYHGQTVDKAHQLLMVSRPLEDIPLPTEKV